VLRRLLPREPDQPALGADYNGPSARRVGVTDGGPPVRIQPAGKQRLLQRMVHSRAKNLSGPDSLRKSTRLLKAVEPDNVKCMSRFIFAAFGWICFAGAAAAQQVPGRDLLEFPVGLLAEAAPLSVQMPGGLWNPAAAALPIGTRAAIGFAALTSPQDLGVDLGQLAGAYRVRQNLTGSLSVTTASVSDILRTETDPTSLGAEIPYRTTLFSAGLAMARGNVSYGVAARYRSGTADRDQSGEFGMDAGVSVDRVGGIPIRIAASTFLFTFAGHDREATYLVAADLPVIRRDSAHVLRVGQAFGHTEGRGREEYTFATGRLGLLELSGGLARNFAFGNSNHRWRLGSGLRYAAYTLAFAREQGAAGLGASYQFLLKRTIQ
jgi:hypothetical protein